MDLMRTHAGEDESEQIWNAGGKYLKLTIPACGSALKTFAEKFAGAQSYAALPYGIHYWIRTKAEKACLDEHIELLSHMPGAKAKVLEKNDN